MKWAMPVLLFMLLAFDGTTHWDETNYLYKGAYSPFDLGADWVHYSGGFYSGRMFHILILRNLFALFGVGIVPFFLVQLVMALCVLGAGLLYYRALKEMALPQSLAYLASMVLLFLPLSIYLAYKALAETTALLMAALSVYLYFVGLKKEGAVSTILLVFSAFALFLATNSRVECLLTFVSLVIPYICFQRSRRETAFRGLIMVGLVWGVLTVILGFSTGIWSLEFMLRRSEVYGAKFAADSINYLPNHIVAVLFGGGLWIFALLSLFAWRRIESKIVWGGLIISMVPIALLADHTELRYYNPAIFSFALAVAIGIEVFYNWLKHKQTLLCARALTLGLFCLLVAANQLVRPLQEVGTQGIPLIRLINRVKEKYTDPVLITAHPHSTYAFLRICYPEMRITLDRDFEGLAPLKVERLEELEALQKPWLYLSSRGPEERPLLIKMIHRLQGVTPAEKNDFTVTGDSWVVRSDRIRLLPADREGRYSVFMVETTDAH